MNQCLWGFPKGRGQSEFCQDHQLLQPLWELPVRESLEMLWALGVVQGLRTIYGTCCPASQGGKLSAMGRTVAGGTVLSPKPIVFP